MIPNWINLSQTAGTGTTTVSVTASSYSELVERTGSLTVRSGDRSAVVTLAQKPNYTITLSPETYEAQGIGESFILYITTEDSWTLTSNDWLVPSQSAGTGNAQVLITVNRNDTGSDRLGYVDVHGSTANEYMTVHQTKIEITPSGSFVPSSIIFSTSSDSRNVEINCNCKWYLESDNFIAITRMGQPVTSGTSGNNIPIVVSVIASQAPRTGHIYLKSAESGSYGTLIATATVTQANRVNGDAVVRFPCSGGSYSFFYNGEAQNIYRADTFVDGGHYEDYQENHFTVTYESNIITVNCLPTSSDWYISTAFYIGHVPGASLADKWIYVAQEPCCLMPQVVHNVYNEYNYSNEVGIFDINPACIIGDVGLRGFPYEITDTTEFTIENLSALSDGASQMARIKTSLALDAYINFYTLGLPKYGSVGYTKPPLLESRVVMGLNQDVSYSSLQSLKVVEIVDGGDGCSPSDRAIGERCFSNCSYLEKVTINSEYITEISELAFENCIMLHELRIPECVESVASNAFSGCGVRDIYIEGYTLPTVSGSFTGLRYNDGVLHVHYGANYSSWLNALPSGWTVAYYPDEYESQYLTIRFFDEGGLGYYNDTSTPMTLEYSKNGGAWTPVTINANTSVGIEGGNSGTTIRVRRLGDRTYGHFVLVGNPNTFCDVYGNIMSMVFGEYFEHQYVLNSSYALSRLFYYCTGIRDASNLILPARTLSPYCYSCMFAGCDQMISAPALPATTLAEGCYEWMFSFCQSLQYAPELPATTLAPLCYQYMFQNVPIFAAPVLSAETLVTGCYKHMFAGCYNLSYIKCLAKNGITSSNLEDWVYFNIGLSEAITGIFVKSVGTNWPSWPYGSYAGIPRGWIAEDVDE